MNAYEVCPSCGAQFESRKALAWFGLPVLLNAFTLPGFSSKVRCPVCSRQFYAAHARFFGFLSATSATLLLGSVIAICILVALASVLF